MRLGTTERFSVDGVPWALETQHVDPQTIAAIAAGLVRDPMRRLEVRPAQRTDGPSARWFRRWLEYRPALARSVIAAAMRPQSLTPSEALFLRVLVFHSPGDGVWQLSGESADLGFDVRRPMARCYATRWDCDGPVTRFADEFVENLSQGIGARIHPRTFFSVAPRLRVPWHYHQLTRPRQTISREEYLTMSNAEVQAHRVIRDATARRKS